jgi:putative glutamine amidotransferase
MLPVIGVTTQISEKKVHVNRDYMQAIMEAGGIPIAIPFLSNNTALQQLVHACDGLLLSGGEDLDPQMYGEDPHPALDVIVPERDDLEMRVLRLFLEQDKPIFAICRGCQILNVAMGGDLYQDLPSQKSSDVNHNQKAPRDYPYHSIAIKQESLLFRVLQAEKIRVNTYHHQAAKQVKAPLVVSAVAADGVIEAIESTLHTYVLGVQWHPEGMAISHDPHAKRLFSVFIEACEQKNNTLEMILGSK